MITQYNNSLFQFHSMHQPKKLETQLSFTAAKTKMHDSSAEVQSPLNQITSLKHKLKTLSDISMRMVKRLQETKDAYRQTFSNSKIAKCKYFKHKTFYNPRPNSKSFQTYTQPPIRTNTNFYNEIENLKATNNKESGNTPPKKRDLVNYISEYASPSRIRILQKAKSLSCGNQYFRRVKKELREYYCGFK